MKKILRLVICAVMIISCLTACSKQENVNLWETATYTEDVELGKGSKTVEVEVKVKEKTVTFTINTDTEL